VVYLSGAHRWVDHLLIAAQRLQTFQFQ